MAGIRTEGDLAQALVDKKRRLLEGRRHALNEAGKFLVGQITRPMRRGYLLVTGRLKSSIGYDVPDESRLEVGVIRPVAGDVLKYAGIQHEGGTVHGKPFLAIPIPYPGNPLFTKAGVSGIRARDVRDNPGQFGFRSTFVAKSVIFGVPQNATRKRRGFMGSMGWDIVPLFSLKSSVTIRAKKYIIEPVTRNFGRVREFIARKVREALNG